MKKPALTALGWWTPLLDSVDFCTTYTLYQARHYYSRIPVNVIMITLIAVVVISDSKVR